MLILHDIPTRRLVSIEAPGFLFSVPVDHREVGAALGKGWTAMSKRCFGLFSRHFWAVLCLSSGMFVTSASRADSFVSYEYLGAVTLPSGASVVDALPDGRVIALASGTVWIETGPAAGTFSNVGTLPAGDFPSFGAAFVRVSPDGTRIAVGNNGGASFGNYRVGVFAVASLTGSWFLANHFDAEWIDDRHIALTAGDFVNPSVVTALDTQSVDPDNPVNPTIIQNIGGASGGVVLDGEGRLYTGNGFTGSGPSGTGAVRAFLFAAWSAALLGGPIVDFENSGTLVVDVLSASPLAMDVEGNLLVGGGDFSISGQYDFAALVRATTVEAALLGGPPADSGNPTQVRQWDPDTPNDFNYYSVQFNATLHRAYVYESSSSALHIYQDVSAVPTVSQWGMIQAGLGIAILGTHVLRRRSWGHRPLGSGHAID